MQFLTFEPVANLWIILVLALGMVAVVAIGPTFAGVDRRQRRWLLILRGCVIALALLALLRPGIVTRLKQRQSAVVAIMLDLSRSMRLPHLATGPTRWESMREMIEANEDKIKAMTKDNVEVKFYFFGSDIGPEQSDRSEPIWPESPDEGETDLGTSMASVLSLSRDQRLLAMILASDGVQNATNPEVELAQSSKAISDAQTPLFTVPFGQPADNSQFADVAVDEMADQYTVWVKNDLVVSATLSARGFANQSIPVQLVLVDPSGVEEVVDTQLVTVSNQNESIRVDLKHVPERSGQFRLLVRALPQPGEISSRNNELPAFLTVNEGGLRVLMLYGSLSWEHTFLRKALSSYRDINLETYELNANRRDQWPLNLTRYFNDRQYDVFILCDVDSRALFRPGIQEATLRALADAVFDGKGLLMVGGYHSFGAGLYHLTPLDGVLPITMDFSERQEFDGAIRQEMHVHGPLVMVPTTQHYITRLANPQENQRLWQQLPPLNGANRFLGYKDSAKVLLESTSNDPLLISTIVGGRVLAFAGDSTWKWWTHGFQDLHKRFWRQVVLWLAFRDGIEGDNIWIDLPQRRFEPNSIVQFTAGANTPTDESAQNMRLSASLIAPDGTGTPITVNAGSDVNPTQVDRRLLQQPGIYAIEVEAVREGRQVGTAKAEFVVFDNDKEQATPGADPGQLNRLANQTSAWGGRMVEAAELGDLLDELAQQVPEMRVEVPKKWQLGDTIWDAFAYVIIFMGLITCEWWLRKKWGLV